MKLTAKQINAVRRMAEWFRSNKGLVQRAEALTAFDMTLAEYEPFMDLMHSSNALAHEASTSNGRFIAFTVGPRILYVEDAIDEATEAAKSPDLVRQLEQRAKASPIMAIFIVLLIAATALATLANQLWDLLIKFQGKP